MLMICENLHTADALWIINANLQFRIFLLITVVLQLPSNQLVDGLVPGWYSKAR